jgi:hypothetical protein
MKLQRAGLAGAILSCALLLAPHSQAQNSDYNSSNWQAPRGYDQAYPESGHANMVARQGYSAGFNEGQADAAKGKKFTPTKNKAYGKAIIPQGMNKDEFKQQYREAFVKGYSAGYKGDQAGSSGETH